MQVVSWQFLKMHPMKIMIFKSIFVTLFLVGTNHLSSQEISGHLDKSKTLVDSVWLWEVKTERSVIYVAGEMHDHKLLPSEVLSHELAETAYKASALIFLEAIFYKRFSKDKLSERITTRTWEKLTEAVRKSVKEKQEEANFLGSFEPDESAKELMKFVDRLPNHLLIGEISALLSPVWKAAKNIRSEVGFLRQTMDQKNSSSALKHRMLEKDDSVEMSWKKHCGSPNDAQDQVELLLNTRNSKSLPFLDTEGGAKLISLFKYNETATAMFVNSVFNLDPTWKILNDCSVAPRNRDWMKRLKPEIEAADKPIMLVVGIGHVVGDTGLLALLCAEGYCKSRRIMNTEEIQAAK
jgi:hypothetical protein